MNASLAKADLSFKDGILTIKFSENTIIEVEDIIYFYCFGFQESGKKPYGILFDSTSKHELSEEGVVYLAKSALDHNIIAVAYISKTLISRIRLNLFIIFEKPVLKPKLFRHDRLASQWLQAEVNAHHALSEVDSVV